MQNFGQTDSKGEKLEGGRGLPAYMESEARLKE